VGTISPAYSDPQFVYKISRCLISPYLIVPSVLDVRMYGQLAPNRQSYSHILVIQDFISKNS
jgi:hypothetical protein